MEEARFVDASEIRTRYFETGRGDVLLLLHGGGFASCWNAEDWELNAPGLAKHFRVVAMDKVGAGFSDNPASDEDYVIGSTVKHADDVIAECSSTGCTLLATWGAVTRRRALPWNTRKWSAPLRSQIAPR